MIRKPQEKLSQQMFECAGSSFKAKPKQKQEQKKKQTRKDQTPEGKLLSTHYLFSDWPKTYSEFSKSAPKTSSSCRLYNNHVKDAQGSRVNMSCMTAVHDF